MAYKLRLSLCEICLNMIPLYIRHESRKEFKYVESDMLVGTFKRKLSNDLSINADTMRLLFAGKILDNPKKRLADYDVHKECSISVLGQPKKKKERSSQVESKTRYLYAFTYACKTKDGMMPSVRFNQVSNKNKNQINDGGIKLFVTDNDDQKVSISRKGSTSPPSMVTVSFDGNGNIKKEVQFENASVILDLYKCPLVFPSQIKKVDEMLQYKTRQLDKRVIKAMTLCEEDSININYVASLNNKQLHDPLIKSEIERLFTISEPDSKIVHINSLSGFVKLSNCNHMFSKLTGTKDGGCYVFLRDGVDRYRLTIALKIIGNYQYVETIDDQKLDRIKCSNCQMPMNYVRCFNKTFYCNKCLDAKVEKVICSNKGPIDIHTFGSRKLISRLTDEIKRKLLEDSIQCPGCNQIFAYEGSFDSGMHPEVDIIGRPFEDEELMDHYVKNRIRCNLCSIEFCKKCCSLDYHTGFDCDSYQIYLKSPKCKFCLNMLSDGSCPRDQCKKWEQMASKYSLECGHHNHGFGDYDLCLDCLGQRDEDCYICMSDKLSSEPCIKLDCGHIFHKGCLDDRLRVKHSTDFITMGYTKCQVCYCRLSHDTINDQVEKMRKDNLDIERLTMEYIKDECLVVPVKETIDKLRFYRCEEDGCGDIFFGGEADCERELMARDDGDEKMKKLCDTHSTIGKQHCDKHGDKYMIYKCGWCCSAASWLCARTMYFCEPCHRNPGGAKIKPCPGPKECILGKEHPPNTGANFKLALGCSICLSDTYLKKIKWIFPKRRY